MTENSNQNKLTIEEAEQKACAMGGMWESSALRQLADTMRESERLRESLMIIGKSALDAMQDDVGPRGAYLKCGWLLMKCEEALRPYKHSEATFLCELCGGMGHTHIWPTGIKANCPDCFGSGKRKQTKTSGDA